MSNCHENIALCDSSGMIALIQRVSQAKVEVEGSLIGAIQQGLLALVAVQPHDTSQSIARMADRILAYRVFSDEQGKMNWSVKEVNGGILLVSQFTLAADTKSGLRPSFTTAAKPEQARAGFDELVNLVKARHAIVETGQFGANMQISLINDGPVTFWLET